MSEAKGERIVLSTLIDESGSMAGKEEAVVSTYNAFIKELRESDEAKDKEVLATLALFDRNGADPILRVQFDAKPLAEVSEITAADYTPRGMTPLNDAFLQTIEKVAATKPDRALIVVQTDGLENASESTAEAVKKAVEAREAEGWRFIYLGANQDAWAEGSSRGIAAQSAYSFQSTSSGIRATGLRVNTSARNFLKSSEKYDEDAQASYAATGNVIADPGESLDDSTKEAVAAAKEGLK